MSSEVSGLTRYVPRTDTTVADAYLSPVLDAYVQRVAGAFDAATRLYFMQSNGGLTPASAFRGRDAVLSGPAGGIIGMAAAAKRAGFDKALGFDMGGTSTDVSHYAGVFERTNDTVVAGVRLTTPMLQIHTVAAGGGSVCYFDGARLRVGPQSAGADPGPACYRRGGPLTITDCNVLLGRVRPEFFPAIFGPKGDRPLDAKMVARAVRRSVLARSSRRPARISRRSRRRKGSSPSPTSTWQRRSARSRSSAAMIRASMCCARSAARAGSMRARWPMRSARGACCCIRWRACCRRGAWGWRTCGRCGRFRSSRRWASICRTRREALIDAGDARRWRRAAWRCERRELTAYLRYDGAEASLPMAWARCDAMRAAFEAAHRARFGFLDPARAILVAKMSAEAIGEDEAPPKAEVAMPEAAPAPLATRGACGWRARLARRRCFGAATLPAGFSVDGPALVLENGATTFVEPGWRGAMTRGWRSGADADCAAAGGRRRSGRRWIRCCWRSSTTASWRVAEEMGLALQTSAASVNIRERLDFSCAVFDAAGGLVANAPHIPVHLGSMSEIDPHGDPRAQRGGRGMKPGDIYMLNAPHAGGTHLPDITVIAPVILEGETAPAFFTAARGHHADIGGITPGSMPPDSKTHRG